MSHRATLTGTLTNCVGGETPEGTWLTCEETVAGPRDAAGASTNLTRNHGYVFDVPANARCPVNPGANSAGFRGATLAIWGPWERGAL